MTSPGDPRSETIRAGYATLAEAYATELGNELADKPLDRAFLRAYAEQVSGLIADVGCGPGQVAAFLDARGVQIEGVDLSPEMIAQAKQQHPSVAFRVGDMCALPYADGALGGVVAFYAIVHTPTLELHAPLREFHRAVAPGGLVALAFHLGSGPTHITELWGRPTALDFWFHPTDAVISALVETGFAIEVRLEREPYPGVEHASQRAYLLARRS